MTSLADRADRERVREQLAGYPSSWTISLLLQALDDLDAKDEELGALIRPSPDPSIEAVWAEERDHLAERIADLERQVEEQRTVLSEAYNALREPHGEWKDVRENKVIPKIGRLLDAAREERVPCAQDDTTTTTAADESSAAARGEMPSDGNESL